VKRALREVRPGLATIFRESLRASAGIHGHGSSARTAADVTVTAGVATIAAGVLTGAVVEARVSIVARISAAMADIPARHAALNSFPKC